VNNLSCSFAVSALVLCALSGTAIAQPEGAGAPQIIAHRTNPHDTGALTAGSIGVITPAITYHGGPVLATPTVYLIWYGNWNQANGSDTSAGQAIIRDFLFGLNNSPYYQTNASYGAPTGLINRSTTEYIDRYSQGTRLSDAAVQAVVSGAIASGELGVADPNGVYFVLTSTDVSEKSGFCNKYCGWHTAGTISGTNIKYAFIGNANRCLNACAAQTIGPNANAGVDGMVSVIAHELEEANTDPDPDSGWVDSKGAENADKCAWTFGANPQGPVNAQYNMTLPALSGGTRNYLVQRDLDANSKCYVNYVTKAQ
jgi:hypothetical protein